MFVLLGCINGAIFSSRGHIVIVGGSVDVSFVPNPLCHVGTRRSQGLHKVYDVELVLLTRLASRRLPSLGLIVLIGIGSSSSRRL